MPRADDGGLPVNPVTAVTHPDPYAYYSELVSRQPCYVDDEVGAVVVSSAELVHWAVADPALRVRQVLEPVPAAMAGNPAGAVFGRLVRMTDGPAQHRLKEVIGNALGTVSAPRVRELTVRTTDAILDRSGSLDDVLFRLPAQVVATLCG